MNAALYALPIDHIKAFLLHAGWNIVNTNDRCFVFEGHADIDDKPFEIVLPINESAPDYPIYVEHTVRILSALAEKPSATVANELLDFNRDSLMIDADAKSVEYAAMQMPPIKRLIGHSANMERSLKPHFNQYYLEARNMLKHFEFNQIRNGRVTHRIESLVGEKEAYQMEIPFDGPDPGEKLPLERRVMERIATGLTMLDSAVRTDDLPLLVEGYVDGFNANMCTAILEISKYSPIPVQYSVNWSRKLPVSQGVNVAHCIQIEPSHIEFLKRARDKLKERKPEFHRIEGRVIGLSSRVDPKSDFADNNERSIVVLRTDRRGLGRMLWMNLGKDEYMSAHRAHIDWKTISVDGFAIKRRAGWQLAAPHNFRVLR